MAGFVFFDDEDEDLVQAESFDNGAVTETFDFGPELGYAMHVDDDTDAIDMPDFEVQTAPHGTSLGGPANDIGSVRRELNIPTPTEVSGAGEAVCLTDSGVDGDHPVFEGMSITQYDCRHGKPGDTGPQRPSDGLGHGTACAGQVAQIAPGAEIIMLRIFGAEGKTGGREIMRAYEWLLANPDRYSVVSMSWGAPQKVDQIDRIHNRLAQNGAFNCVAAGNSGEAGGSPATAKRAFSVGASTIDGRVAEFSSYNPEGAVNPEVVAPGVNIMLARAHGTRTGEPITGKNKYTNASGTSFACPEVAAGVALLRELNPDRKVADLEADLIDNSRDIPNTVRDGAGIVDYKRSSGQTTAGLEERTERLLVDFYGVDAVETDHTFDDGRQANFIAHAGVVQAVVEVHDESYSPLQTAGRALYNAEHVDDGVPIMVVWEDDLDTEERVILDRMPVIVKEMVPER